MSQSAALLRARLDSGASACSSGRPHISPHHASVAARRRGARQPSKTRLDAAQQYRLQAARAAQSGAALAAWRGLRRQRRSDGDGCRRSRGTEQRCRARSRVVEEDPSEDEDLDALVEDSAGGSPNISSHSKHPHQVASKPQHLALTIV